jgi:hypothetical protein
MGKLFDEHKLLYKHCIEFIGDGIRPFVLTEISLQLSSLRVLNSILNVECTIVKGAQA